MSDRPLARGPIGRADLVALGLYDGDERGHAGLFGFEYVPRAPEVPSHFDGPSLPGRPPPEPRELVDKPLLAVPFLCPVGFRRLGDGPTTEEPPQVDFVPHWPNAPTAEPEFLPLADPASLRRIVERFEAGLRQGRSIDLPLVVDRLSRAEPLTRLPRRSHPRPGRIQLLADRSLHLAPFWRDQLVAFEALATAETRIWWFDELAMDIRSVPDGDAAGPQPDDGALVVFGDLGAFGGAGHRRFWRQFGERFARAGRSLLAISPCHPDDMPADLARLWSVALWERPSGEANSDSREQQVEHLLKLASPVARLEPGLLRALRRRCTRSDAVVELLVWRHEALASSNIAAATFKPGAIEAYRAEFDNFARAEPDVARDAWGVIREWRGRIGAEFMFEEILDRPPDVRESIVEPQDIVFADRFWREIGEAASKDTLQRDAFRWLHETSHRRQPNGALWAHEGAAQALRRASVSIAAPKPVRLLVSQHGEELHVGHQARGALLAEVLSADGVVELPQPPRPAIPIPEMVPIPAGSFLMGSPETEEGRYSDEGPQHRVEIAQPFELAKHPLTFAEYDFFCEATGREKPFDWGWGRGRRPVINVSWEDAQAYCDWLSAQTGDAWRLPSEAEWEYACRAGTRTRYWWGDDWDASRANGGGAVGMTTEVGSYPANPWGLYDIHGNVRQWCADDWADDYSRPRSQTAFRRKSGVSRRVIRGGSWSDDVRVWRASCRHRRAPASRYDNIGFRPARGQAPGAQASGRNAEHSGAGQAKAGVAEPPAGPGPRRMRVMPGGSDSFPLADLPPAPFVLRTDRAELVIQRITRSDLGGWASGIGRDRFGLWADFTVDDIRQRLRFCPPGRFVMGSPQDEAGRNADEGPQTEISFAEGFWIFDTPVTVRQWRAFHLASGYQVEPGAYGWNRQAC